MAACEACAYKCCSTNPDAIDCTRLCLDCAAMCRLVLTLQSRGSKWAARIAAVCADLCAECATECGKYNDEYCRQCTEICTRCADECREMARG